MSECYQICNEKYGVTDARRTYCKKGCDSEDDLYPRYLLYLFIFKERSVKRRIALLNASNLNWVTKRAEALEVLIYSNELIF